jgi:putative acetyltransferase
MRIRAIARTEETLIADLWRRSWASANPQATPLEPPEHWLARVRSEFSKPSELVVVETTGGIGAFIVFNVASAYVAQLFTEPCLQGQGLGRALLGEASRRMMQGWSLHVATTNHRAHLFYERFGLVRGAVDSNPVTGRERVAYTWPAPSSLLVADTQQQNTAARRLLRPGPR